MKVSQLDLPKPTIEFLSAIGYETLYPAQEDSVKAGLLEGKSILVSAPTASGKTLIALFAILNHIFKKKGKIVYLSPLKALASEKFSEFKKLESIDLGKKIQVEISTGDFDITDKNLGKNDILVLTNEKMDSIIRHGTEWINDISLVIADEIHLIGDQDRGPTLEIVLTKLKLLEQKPQILALSATVTNADDISSWLDSELVKSDWRPVPLWEGVYDQGVVIMQDGKKFVIETSIRGAAVDLGIDSLKNGGQAILFAETRARSASLAAKASDVIGKSLPEEEKKELDKISQKILDDNEHTDLIKNLATLVKKGVAFHHAGLNQNCRETIESEFRSGKIKLIASTPTLAAGVNLPARRVIISNINRYDAKFGGNKPISVLEYKQLCGRAGRPQYDSYGEAIIVGNSNRTELIDYYINGTHEPIKSKLTDDKALRTHVLSLVSTNPGIKKNEIIENISEYDCSRSLLAMNVWINESSEIFLSDNLGIESGDMHRMVENADWLIHSLYELAKLETRDDLLDELNVLRQRISYGIKEELVELVRIRGIGRIRSRILYKNGIQNLHDLSEIPVNKLANIDKIGSTLAENIKIQLQKIR